MLPVLREPAQTREDRRASAAATVGREVSLMPRSVSFLSTPTVRRVSSTVVTLGAHLSSRANPLMLEPLCDQAVFVSGTSTFCPSGVLNMP